MVSLADRYELTDPIGEGGMGTVYRATDTVLGRDVAIKFLREDIASDPATVERFRREARIAASLSHPGICSVYDFAQDDSKYFIVMELLEGRDLHTILMQDGALEPQAAAGLFAAVAEALEAAHRAGAVHRDVKPGNIFVTDDGPVKITDFGIATVAGQSTLTGSGAMLGTPHYLSPEQVDGQVATARSDIYALGCVMFQALTGRTPYIGETSMAVALSHREQPPPSARELDATIPVELDRIITKAMAKSPGMRYASAGQMASDLRAFSGDRTVALTSPSATQILEPLIPDKRKRKPLLAVAAIALAILVLALIARSCDQEASAAPRLVGLTVAEATLEAADAGYRVSEARRPDASAPEGVVIEQTPAPGVAAPEGSVIAIVVSSGGVIVPDVSDDKREDAVRSITAAGLVPEVVSTTEGGEPDTVASQAPPSGTVVAPGSTVQLTLFEEKEEEERDKGKGKKEDD